MKGISKKIKKWLSIAIMTMMTVSTLPASAFAAGEACSVTYEVSPLGAAGVSGPSAVNPGEALLVSVTPEGGYAVDSVTANGVPCAEENVSSDGNTVNYVFPNIAGNTHVLVTMKHADTAAGVVTGGSPEGGISADRITSWSYADGQEARYVYPIGTAPASLNAIEGKPEYIDAVINGEEHRRYAITGWKFNADESVAAEYNPEAFGEYIYDAELEAHPAFALGVSWPQAIIAVTVPTPAAAPLLGAAPADHTDTIVTGVDGDFTTYQNKYIEPTNKIYNKNYTNTITLEGWVDGDVLESKLATEIVLELDYSASMDEPTNDLHRRWKALGLATKEFLDVMARENDSRPADKKIYITIKGYNYRVYTIQDRIVVSSTNVESVKSRILDMDEGLDWPGDPWGPEHMGWMCNTVGALAGGTRTDLAMGDARSILENSDCALKSCVLVTDGVPAIDETGGTPAQMVSLGNTALTHARAIKDDGGYIFTVFIGGTDEQIKYADTHDTLGDLSSSGANYPMVFLALSSSDNPKNGSISMTGPHYNETIDSEWQRCTITSYVASTDTGATVAEKKGYFLDGTKFPETMAQIIMGMHDIGAYLSHFSGRTGPYSRVSDVITWPFEVDPDVPIKVYTQDRVNNGGTFGWADTLVDVTDQVRIVNNASKNTVTVRGFDYEANCVTTEPKLDTGKANDYGSRLVVKFDIRLADPNFGGNTIPTNETSSVWLPDSIRIEHKDDNYPIGYYKVPHTDLIVDYDVIGQDQYIYIPDKASLDLMVQNADNINGPLHLFKEGYSPDGWNNAFVDIEYTLYDPENNVIGTMSIPAQTSYEDCSWTFPGGNQTTVGGQYRIHATVTPVDTTDTEVTTGETVQMSTANGPYTQKEYETKPWVYIFKPEVTFADDKLMYKNAKDENGDIIPGVFNDLYLRTKLGDQASPANRTEFKWVCEQDPSIESLFSREPALIYNLSVLSGAENDTVSGIDVVKVTADAKEVVAIDVKVKREDSGADITEQTTFSHECSVGDPEYHAHGTCDFDDTHGDAEFYIHIKKKDVEPFNKATYNPQIIIDKEIDKFEAAFGSPTFVYRIEGTDNDNVYYGQIIIEGNMLNGSTGTIYVAPGSYKITEMSGSRYAQVSVEAVEPYNEHVTETNNDGIPYATVTLAAARAEENRQIAEVKFINEISHFEKLSEITGVKNRLGTDADQEGQTPATFNTLTFDANGGNFHGRSVNEAYYVKQDDGTWEYSEDSDTYAIPTKLGAGAGEQGSKTYNYTGGDQTFTAPLNGTVAYTFELYGANGGSDAGKPGGNGAYLKGTVNLTKNQQIVIKVGGAGGDSVESTVWGGWNGGGRCWYSGGGGGMTSLHLNNKLIAAAAGGGGALYYHSAGHARVSTTPKVHITGSTNGGNAGNGAGGGGGWHGGEAGDEDDRTHHTSYGGINGFDSAYFKMLDEHDHGTVSGGNKKNYHGHAVVSWSIPDYYDNFIGWFTEPEGGEEVDIDSLDMTQGDVTVYAHWRAGSY